MSSFKIIKKSKISKARIGLIETRHSEVKTPFFLPIATRGAVKSLTSEDLENLGTEIILANTYHLMQRPGVKIIKKAGGLHKFMNWERAILTDSGGFQVFSLAKRREIKKDGVKFYSEIDGKRYFLTPEEAIKIQNDLGSDIILCLDVCSHYSCSYQEAKEAVELTTKWAIRCKAQSSELKTQSLLFGIIQGSIYKDLRIKSTKEILALNFDGYAIGGLAVGEPEEKMFEVLKWVLPLLPEDKPHYLLGVGKPEQIVKAVKMGIDMFDCVIPTREARHRRLYKIKNPCLAGRQERSKIKNINSKFYEIINIFNKKYAKDFSSIDKNCYCQTCKNYSRAYLRHLFSIQEPLALRLATLHNLAFYLNLMRKIRELIYINKF